jgi:glutamate/tyrosine decarboxylase-like PLP-dependent enzyme
LHVKCLATAWDQNAGPSSGSPIAAALEHTAIGWIRDLLGLPAGSGGSFVTGASMANFCGLAAARHAILGRQGWDAERYGLFGAPPITVIVGEEAHAALLKALSLLGLGRDRVVRIPTDSQGRMRADKLPPLSGSTIVCIQAGNVNTGALDPARPICTAARAAQAWVHIDGAFGLWAAAAPARAFLADGIELADSWALDAHKWLNVPYDGGLAIVADRAALNAAMGVSASYLPDEAGREPIAHVPESSRRARAIPIYAALRQLGRDGLAELVERNCALARRAAAALEADGAEVLNDVVLNQVLVRFGDDETTRAVIAAVQRSGEAWLGGTVWEGRAAARISVSNWSTTEADIDRLIAAFTAARS